MQKYIPLLMLFLASSAGADVLTPYRTSNIYVQASYPTYPFPKSPTLAQYQIAADSIDSNFGSDIRDTIGSPTHVGVSDATAEASAQYGAVHAYSTAVTDNVGADPIYGAATAAAAFGDGFTILNGPANGVATFSILFEGTLVNSSALSFDSSVYVGAYAELEASVQQNFVGGVTLFDATLVPGRITENVPVAAGVTITFGSAVASGNSLAYTYNVRMPYQAGKDYFLTLNLGTSADKNGTADFLNTAAITNFQADPAASIVFDSGTPLAAFGAVPEPGSFLMLAVGGVALLSAAAGGKETLMAGVWGQNSLRICGISNPSPLPSA